MCFLRERDAWCNGSVSEIDERIRRDHLDELELSARTDVERAPEFAVEFSHLELDLSGDGWRRYPGDGRRGRAISGP